MLANGRRQFRYFFDNSLSRRGAFLLWMLAALLVAAAAIALIAAVLRAIPALNVEIEAGSSAFENFWLTLGKMLALGTAATVDDFVAWAQTADNGNPLPIIAIDNVPGCSQLETYELPETCAFLFGQEGPGLSQAALDASTAVLEITQFGSTRSINASAAAAIVMHRWVQTHRFGG